MSTKRTVRKTDPDVDTAHLCDAKLTSRDGRCKQPAGFGTDHVGVGRCRFHFGSTESHARNAGPASLAMLTGIDIDVNPFDALLLCVRVAAAEVQFFTCKILEMGDVEDVAGQPVKDAIASTKDDWDIVELKMPLELSIWVKARRESVDNLAKYSALAIKAGVEERLVSIAEQTGMRLATALEAILNELQLTPTQMQKAPTAIRSQLMLLEGRAA